MRYRLIRTAGYEEGLRKLDGGSGRIDQLLNLSVYWYLERNPRLGLPTMQPGLWVMRRRVIEDVLTIRVLYTSTTPHGPSLCLRSRK